MTSPVDIETLRRRLEKCPRLERRSLGRWLTRVGRMARKGRPVDRSFDRIAREIDRAVATRRARVAARSSMRLEYPESLPVSAHHEELLEVRRSLVQDCAVDNTKHGNIPSQREWCEVKV